MRLRCTNRAMASKACSSLLTRTTTVASPRPLFAPLAASVRRFGAGGPPMKVVDKPLGYYPKEEYHSPNPGPLSPVEMEYNLMGNRLNGLNSPKMVYRTGPNMDNDKWGVREDNWLSVGSHPYGGWIIFWGGSAFTLICVVLYNLNVLHWWKSSTPWSGGGGRPWGRGYPWGTFPAWRPGVMKGY
ncbi:unnamed protein product [Vitrella brassicaformis CCMP3155]|uniref:Uncharacterized protein n=1 Tax=Vitrella brassicaformis (strain CCMP3155) TaxID=1169540 RepID=A0A0G4GJ46_VITBC|nr:unnamed protein product [Vitrella brassicaformis CCMP3155]|eukprot:CEM29855.1 unnamed protein product [Vitrella brassicaformis CCMP3155]